MKVPLFYQNLFDRFTKELRLSLTEKCKQCNHGGYIETGDNMFKDCQCTTEFFSKKKYSASGVNVKHIAHADKWFFDEFDEKTYNMLSQIKTHLLESKKVNFMISPINIKTWGASHIGNQIIKYYIDAGFHCAVASSKHMMDLFFSWDNPDLKDCLEYLLSVDILLIDEFGSEYNSKMKDNKSYVANNFNAFIMERKRNDKTTIIASNFPKEHLKKTYASEIHNVIVSNFAALEVRSNRSKKSEFDTIGLKITTPGLIDCFTPIENISDKKRGVF